MTAADKYREEFSESLIGFYNDRFELLQTLDTFAAILERALTEQREGIAKAIEQWKDDNPSLQYDEAGWSRNAYNDSAAIAREFGKDGAA